MSVPFITDHDPCHGQAIRLTPRLRRITASNAGKFTGWGTGTYLIGNGDVAIVDPGPDDDAHVAAVLAAVAGETVTHILITHTHRDHSPAWAAIQAATDAPTYGFGPHPAADFDARSPDGDGDGEGEGHDEEPGDATLVPDVAVAHGATIIGGDWIVDAVHTPGHISNHLCFGVREEAALLTGDHVMGWSTTVIPPPDGNMAHYLASLELLLTRDDEVYWPTHGPPIHDPHTYVRALLEHRRDREAQIIAALESGPRTIAELVAELYADVGKELHKPAGRSVYAHLIHLQTTGRVTATPELSPTATFGLSR